MKNLGLGLIIGGGFLFGIGMGHIVLVSNIIATLGVLLIAAGLIALFACGNSKNDKGKKYARVK